MEPSTLIYNVSCTLLTEVIDWNYKHKAVYLALLVCRVLLTQGDATIKAKHLYLILCLHRWLTGTTSTRLYTWLWWCEGCCWHRVMEPLRLTTRITMVTRGWNSLDSYSLCSSRISSKSSMQRWVERAKFYVLCVTTMKECEPKRTWTHDLPCFRWAS